MIVAGERVEREAPMYMYKRRSRRSRLSITVRASLYAKDLVMHDIDTVNSAFNLSSLKPNVYKLLDVRTVLCIFAIIDTIDVKV